MTECKKENRNIAEIIFQIKRRNCRLPVGSSVHFKINRDWKIESDLEKATWQLKKYTDQIMIQRIFNSSEEIEYKAW